MDAGTLDKRITFTRAKKQTGKYGTVQNVQENVLTCWARIEPTRGRDYFEATVAGTEDYFKITTRFHRGLSDDMRIVYQGREFEIKNIVDPYEAHTTLEFYCQARQRGKGAET